MKRTPRAQSRYRQVRLTFTAELGGQVSYSISAKALNAAWNEHDVLVRDSVRCPVPESTEDVFRALLVILNEQLTPGLVDFP